MKIAIVTDSSYGKGKLYDNLYIAPLLINLDGTESIEDTADFTKEQFLNLIKKNSLKTSQTPIGKIIELYDNLLKEYDQIVVCGLAKSLSGQHNGYLLAAEEPQFKDKVFIINSNGVSIILEHEIARIVALIDQGKTGPEILTAINDINNAYECYILPKSWDTFVKSGRISRIKAMIVTTLKINIVLKVQDDKIVFDSKHRGFFSSVKFIVNSLKAVSPTDMIDVAYGYLDDETVTKVKEIIANAGFKINLWSELPKTILVNTGPETLAFSIWKK
ncbi:putative DegV family protein [Spiroplasma syrphidicola EA-1]|uniref:Putative DegV family protein n=1 Tax=Spiroplasma syrphidicola EA-1 TaxID=1276229 RepID=R4UMF2_9MOLU|nr:DegV family protein [Spiroplasma syrphidicola]AGM26416.1 putative DegV family protein [Spiroplasma syrphidicola EA-1]